MIRDPYQDPGQLRPVLTPQLRALALVRRWLPPLLVVAAIATGTWLRLLDLDRVHPWWDEAWTAWLARLPVAEMAGWTLLDLHPPLHYLLLGWWSQAAGESVYALRFLSVASGVLLIPLGWQLARGLAGAWAGVAAAWLLATARFLVWWSQEIRMYAPAALLAVLSLVLVSRILQGDQRRTTVLGLALATAAGMATHYLFLVVPLTWALLAGLRILLRQTRPAETRRLASAALLAFLLYLPWLGLYLVTLRPRGAGASLDWDLYSLLLLNVLPLGLDTDIVPWYPPAVLLWVLAGTGAITGIILLRRTGRWITLALALLALAVPLLLFGAGNLPAAPFQPKLGARYLAILAPFFTLLVALAIGLAWRRVPLAGLALLLVALGAQATALASWYPARLVTPSLPLAGTLLEAHVQPGDTVVLLPAGETPVFRYYAPSVQDWLLIDPRERLDQDQAAALLSRLVADGRDGIWLVTSRETATTDPAGAALAWLRATYREVAEADAGDLEIRLFSPDPARQMTTLRQPQPHLPPDLRAGDAVPLPVAFPGAGIVQARLELTRPGGETQLRRPVTVPAGSRVAPLILTVSPGTPPGPVRVNAVGLDASGAEVARVSLGSAVVRPSAAPPPAGTPAGARFGSVATLAAASIPASLPPAGEPLVIVLDWQAGEPADTSWTVFVHLLDAAGRRIAQIDQLPGNGRRPTTSWDPGERIQDRLVFPVDPAWAGPVTVSAGLYDPRTGQRVPVLDEAGNPASTTVELGPILPRPD